MKQTLQASPRGYALLQAIEQTTHPAESLAATWRAEQSLRAFFKGEPEFLAWAKNRHRAMHLGTDRNVELLAGGLQSMGFRNVQGTYFLGYDRGSAEWVRRIALQTTTDQPIELHKWIGSVPAPTKFDGERRRNSLTDYGIAVASDKYESTVDGDIDDVRRDKTGHFLRQIADLGAKAASLDERLMTGLLESSATCYDGLSLWNTAHKIGNSPATQSNDVTVTGIAAPDAPTTAEMARAIGAGVQQLLGMLDDRGDPMNQGATRFAIVSPTKYWQSVAGAVSNQFTSAGVSNTLPNSGVQFSQFTNSRLKGTSDAAGRRIYVFREDAAVPPFIVQDEAIPDAFKSMDAYSSDGFWREKLAWGAKRLCAVAPVRFELGVRINLAA